MNLLNTNTDTNYFDNKQLQNDLQPNMTHLFSSIYTVDFATALFSFYDCYFVYSLQMDGWMDG